MPGKETSHLKLSSGSCPGGGKKKKAISDPRHIPNFNFQAVIKCKAIILISVVSLALQDIHQGSQSHGGSDSKVGISEKATDYFQIKAWKLAFLFIYKALLIKNPLACIWK